MSKSATIRARMEENTKKKAEKIFSKLGLTTSEAINLFYYQVILRNGIPFTVSIPNKETIKTFKNTDNNKELNKVSSIKELFKELEI